MEFTRFVAFKGSLARYKIISLNGNIFRAFLVQYDGKDEHPPKSIIFYNEDGACMGNSDSIDLISELCHRIHEPSPLDEVLNSHKRYRKKRD